jgi:hypothetical protein
MFRFTLLLYSRVCDTHPFHLIWLQSLGWLRFLVMCMHCHCEGSISACGR